MAAPHEQAESAATLPLSDAAQRLRRPPGRPRKTPGVTPGVTGHRSGGRPRPQVPAAAAPAPASPSDPRSSGLALTPRLLSAKVAAAYLSVSPWLIRRLIEAGALTPVRLAGARRVLLDRHQLDQLVEEALAATSGN